ncbi:phytoene desaturase family protein [Sinosporangium siamense]|uniref:Pyridine nucleotide-disulfide oxidoreductase domain-containing protein 2 n=1 Tax=Sinosporangium siamense TaxID=1367973 RepID=A0A919VAA6_9ACTN|nr:NAD(P)/FAD-dependent oxidoreductase [Sinosporangium siamense]GII95207.1 FAD-dependent oxidoreductase [Sinosporangium siamense]
MTHVVIVGGGHNGLVSAAYLARSGLEVTVLEARPMLGGACVTEEVMPGYRASTCAFVLGLMRPEIVADLRLKEYGLELYSSPDALAFTTEPSGRHFFMWKEPDRTLREVRRRFGPRDADAFAQFGMDMQRLGAVLRPLMMQPPPSLADVAGEFERRGSAGLYERFVTGSVTDLLGAYFESDLLKGFLAFSGVVSVYGAPSTPGTAYVLAHHSVGEFEGHFGKWGFARGGVGALTAAIASAAAASGARLRTSAPVDHVVVRDGKARGVVLASGEEISADLVLSNADPRRSLLTLVGPEHLPGETVSAVEAYDVRGSQCRVLIAADRLPEYTGLPKGQGPQHNGHTFLSPDLDHYEAAFEAARAGRLPEDPVVELTIDSVREPGLVPPGRHMIVTGVQQLPFELTGRTWDDARQDLTDLMLDRLYEHAPNMRGAVLGTHTITPLDLEREYGLTGGNIYHGAMTPAQLLSGRPVAGWGAYRTPVDGFYLCGSGTHPGGGVLGASGYNAAMAVLTDLGVATPRPWGSEHAARELRRRGFEDVLHAAYASPLKKVMNTAARQPWLRKLTNLATRRPGGKK